MGSERHFNRIDMYEDWQDGMNAFRRKATKEIARIFDNLKEIKQEINKLKETP
jgi:quinol monooxygenase YgiN